jgi:hypothetical protein
MGGGKGKRGRGAQDGRGEGVGEGVLRKGTEEGRNMRGEGRKWVELNGKFFHMNTHSSR